MKVFITSFLLCAVFLGLFCSSCATEKKQEIPPAITFEPQPHEPKVAQPEADQVKPVDTTPAEQKTKDPKVTAKPLDESVVVAEIGDYDITRGELKTELIEALRGNSDREKRVDRVDAETVLLKMVGEKAMIIDGRAMNRLESNISVLQSNERDLLTLLLTQEVASKIMITEAEIEKKIKSDPTLDRTKAERRLHAEKSRKLIDKYLEELKIKRNFEKLKYNYPKAVQIYQRLRYSPQKPRRAPWIQGSQIREELSDEEKNIPLAKFDGGAVTVKDWLIQLHGYSPPKRPKDLNTMQGVDRLLDKTSPMRLWVAEAKRLGLHKDPKYMRTARNREDRFLLNDAKREVFISVAQPTDAEVREHFEQNKDDYRKKDTLLIDQIWCEDIETAKKVRAELDAGKEFAAAKELYSLEKRKSAKPLRATVETDGVFLTELWAAEPNDIVGPLKGFYPVREDGKTRWEIRWRVVKILKKEPGAPNSFKKSAYEVKRNIKRQRREALLAKHRSELLLKCSYKLYRDRIKGIDPFEIP